MPTDYGGLSMARQLAAMLRDPARAAAAARAAAQMRADVARTQLEAEQVRKLPPGLPPARPRGAEVDALRRKVDALQRKMAELLKALRSGKGDKRRMMQELQLLRKRLMAEAQGLEKYAGGPYGEDNIERPLPGPYGEDNIGRPVMPVRPTYRPGTIRNRRRNARYRISRAVRRR